MASANRLMGPAKLHKQKFQSVHPCQRTYWKNYSLKVF